MKAQTTLCTYPANLKAIIALIFFCFLFFYQEKKRKSGCGGEAPAKAQRTSYANPTHPMKAKTTFCAYSEDLMAIISLIFFYFLFFYQEKKRKSGHGGEASAKAPTNLLRLSNAPHEGPNNPPRPFGQLDGNHRMNPLVIHLHSSIRETKCGAHSRTIRLRFSKLLSPIQRTK